MTPTREQVIEWAKAANILQPVELLETNQWRNDLIRELVRFATLAMAAGREQGLREAKEVCEANPERQQADGFYIADQQACAAAIEQLRAK